MGTSMQVRVRGQEKLSILSRNLSNFNIQNNIQQALVGAGQRIMTSIKSETPVDTGFLKGSIRMNLNTREDKVTIAENSMQRSGTPYGYFVHEGTSKMRARPYFDWGSNREKGTIDSMGKRLGKQMVAKVVKGV